MIWSLIEKSQDCTRFTSIVTYFQLLHWFCWSESSCEARIWQSCDYKCALVPESQSCDYRNAAMAINLNTGWKATFALCCFKWLLNKIILNQGLPVSSAPINLRRRSCLSSLVHKMDPMFTTAGPCLINKIIYHIYTVIYTCPILVYVVAYNFYLCCLRK